MSDLIESVAKHIHDFWGPYHDGDEWENAGGWTKSNTKGTAIAAVEAVVEWLETRKTPLQSDPYGSAIKELRRYISQPPE